jgi:DNA-binding NarL/FixJ family response regulator
MKDTLISTLIIDDHAIFRAGLIKLLDSNHQISVIGELDSGEELESFFTTKHPDLIILDISLPRMNGLELIGLIKRKSPKTKILVLSMHRVAEYCRLALKRGARGYVLKEDAFEELNHAIESIFSSDENYISPSITKAVADQFLESNHDILPDILTKTEKIVLEKIASGSSNKQVGQEMGISVRTVETHRAHILKKLKLKNTAGLVQYAVKQNLIQINKAD